MFRRILFSFFVFILTFVCLAFLLSNLPVKGRPLWCYLNKTITIKGGQAFNMTRELANFSERDSTFLILGSSHAYRGYDPTYFRKQGVDIFNAGSSAQSLCSTLELLKYYRPKFNKLILDIYPGSVCYNTDESTINLMQNTPDPALAFEFFRSSVNIFTFNNFIYRIARLTEQPLYRDEGYVERGYVKTEDVLSGSVATPGYNFDEKEWVLLEEIIGYCNREKIELSLVSHPLPKPAGRNSGYWYFKHRIEKLCNGFGIQFYDYTYKYDLDSTYFKDHNHLNQRGVDLFNKLLIEDKFKRVSGNRK